MCGIWGFFPNTGKFDETDMGLLDQIMTLTALRGKDSTGVAVISEMGMKPRTIKMVGGPDFLLNSDAWGKVHEFAVKKGTAMFGHGRYGTKGAAIAKNAHPHTVEHITMVHNGTIQWGLDDVMKELNTDNDSLALTHQIAKLGIAEALDSVVGAYAIIVHDAKQGKVFFVRNDERPLHIVNWMSAAIVMSEQKALEYLIDRNVGYQKPEVKFFAKHVIYEYDLTTGKLETDNSLVELKAKKYSYPATTPTPPTAGSKNYETTGGRKTTSITRYYAEGRKLMLIDCEKMPKGTDFRLTFMDEDNAEVASYTRFDQKDRLGEEAVAYQINATRTSAGKEFLHATYKDLKWPHESKKPAPEEKAEVTGQSVTFRNQIQVNKSEAKRILTQHDCALCQGVVRETEIPDTILMSNKQLICPDCIKQGKHHSFGFGQ